MMPPRSTYFHPGPAADYWETREMDALNKYLEATQDHLGVGGQRYGGGFVAIVANRSVVEFLFEKLDGDDFDGTEAQHFLWENPLFPSAHGSTPQDALAKLNGKIERLYDFYRGDDRGKLVAARRFSLKAQYDADQGEERDWYDVQWVDVVRDLQTSEAYFYEASKDGCGYSEKRDLNALITFKYEGQFAFLRD
nr:hypothetical protein [Pseudomonas aeruginosa]EIU2862368.1 hypothetical protein [Pseudomonas aeruginosa]